MNRSAIFRSDGECRGGLSKTGPFASPCLIHTARWSLAAVALAVLAGCASGPRDNSAPASVPPTPTLQQFMDEAARAHTEGARNKERDTYRAAAAAHPTSKEPWVKLAEGYFEESDYGNTILSAQEVLHRDTADTVATSLLAVSGLRVASTALVSLREQRNLGADTRSQAEGVARVLRDVLGEPVLVPKPDTPPPAPRRPAAPRPAPRPAVAASAVAAPAVPAVAKPAAAPVAPAAPAAAKPASPFDKLK
jgi:hypothetical protein